MGENNKQLQSKRGKQMKTFGEVKSHVAIVCILLFLFLLTAAPAMATFRIVDDATGGDCGLIGNWDATTKTCTVTTDILSTDTPREDHCWAIGNVFCAIKIESDFITLDGNGHSLTFNSEPTIVPAVGIGFEGRTKVTVRNFRIKDFIVGISFMGDAWWIPGVGPNIDNTIENNHISSCLTGIDRFYGGDGNRIINNTIVGNRKGIDDQHGGNTLIEGNEISDNYAYGIGLWGPNGNIITKNTLSNNGTGLGHGFTSNLVVYNNNFINNNTYDVYCSPCGVNNVYNLDTPDGGNYWSNYDTPTEGCNDLNNDGFCDLPLYLYDGVDYLPWTTQDGWVTPQAVIDEILGDLGDLVDSGTLDQAEADALATTLGTASDRFDADKINAGCGILTGFNGQLTGLLNSGALTEEQVLALQEAAAVEECQ
jgi:parallel beta-helix repeat protein